MLIADPVGEGPTRASISALRQDIADLRARLDESADALPHRRRYLLLANDFLRGLLDLHLDWVERVEAELDPPMSSPSGGSPRSGSRLPRGEP